MMKKLIMVLLVIGILIGVTGCSSTTVMKNSDIEGGKEQFSMFVEVERVGVWRVVYDSETKVMYTVSDGMYNTGTFTLLVNSDGSPKIWEGK